MIFISFFIELELPLQSIVTKESLRFFPVVNVISLKYPIMQLLMLLVGNIGIGKFGILHDVLKKARN